MKKPGKIEMLLKLNIPFCICVGEMFGMMDWFIAVHSTERDIINKKCNWKWENLTIEEKKKIRETHGWKYEYLTNEEKEKIQEEFGWENLTRAEQRKIEKRKKWKWESLSKNGKERMERTHSWWKWETSNTYADIWILSLNDDEIIEFRTKYKKLFFRNKKDGDGTVYEKRGELTFRVIYKERRKTKQDEKLRIYMETIERLDKQKEEKKQKREALKEKEKAKKELLKTIKNN